MALRDAFRRAAVLTTLLGLLAAGVEPALAHGAGERVNAAAIEAHTRFLADDLLEGREAGSRWFDIAAAYVAAQFAALGLELGGEGGWFQQVPLCRRTLVSVAMSIRSARGTIVLQNGVDAAVDASAAAPRDSVHAGLVFIGWGISAPALNHDDYAGRDVRGRTVVMFEGAPATFPGALRAHYGWVDQKAAMAVAHGAVAVLTIKTPKREAVSPWERARINRPRPAMSWIGHDGVVGSRFGIPAITLGPQAAHRLFAIVDRNLDALMAKADEGRVDGFDLASTLEFERTSLHEDTKSANVLGILRGSDPSLRSEYVFVTAHLDHVGVGPAVGGDRIYNGAVDNAGGVAVMLELARALSAGRRPKRSVVFVATTAEEKGLLGATYYTEFPTIPLGRVVADVNIDGLLAFYNFSTIVALGAEHSTLGRISARAAARIGVREVPDSIPERGNLALSDQYPFLRAGVPVLFPLPGRERGRDGSDGDAAWHDFMETRYHQPSDDMNQPWRWDVAARWGDYLLDVVRQTGSQRARPDGRAHFARGLALDGNSECSAVREAAVAVGVRREERRHRRRRECGRHQLLTPVHPEVGMVGVS